MALLALLFGMGLALLFYDAGASVMVLGAFVVGFEAGEKSARRKAEESSKPLTDSRESL